MVFGSSSSKSKKTSKTSSKKASSKPESKKSASQKRQGSKSPTRKGSTSKSPTRKGSTTGKTSPKKTSSSTKTKSPASTTGRSSPGPATSATSMPPPKSSPNNRWSVAQYALRGSAAFQQAGANHAAKRDAVAAPKTANASRDITKAEASNDITYASGIPTDADIQRISETADRARQELESADLVARRDKVTDRGVQEQSDMVTKQLNAERINIAENAMKLAQMEKDLMEWESKYGTTDKLAGSNQPEDPWRSSWKTGRIGRESPVTSPRRLEHVQVADHGGVVSSNRQPVPQPHAMDGANQFGMGGYGSDVPVSTLPQLGLGRGSHDRRPDAIPPSASAPRGTPSPAPYDEDSVRVYLKGSSKDNQPRDGRSSSPPHVGKPLYSPRIQAPVMSTSDAHYPQPAQRREPPSERQPQLQERGPDENLRASHLQSRSVEPRAEEMRKERMTPQPYQHTPQELHAQYPSQVLKPQPLYQEYPSQRNSNSPARQRSASPQQGENRQDRESTSGQMVNESTILRELQEHKQRLIELEQSRRYQNSDVYQPVSYRDMSQISDHPLESAEGHRMREEREKDNYQRHVTPPPQKHYDMSSDDLFDERLARARENTSSVAKIRGEDRISNAGDIESELELNGVDGMSTSSVMQARLNREAEELALQNRNMQQRIQDERRRLAEEIARDKLKEERAIARAKADAFGEDFSAFNKKMSENRRVHDEIDRITAPRPVTPLMDHPTDTSVPFEFTETGRGIADLRNKIRASTQAPNSARIASPPPRGSRLSAEPDRSDFYSRLEKTKSLLIGMQQGDKARDQGPGVSASIPEIGGVPQARPSREDIHDRLDRARRTAWDEQEKARDKAWADAHVRIERSLDKERRSNDEWRTETRHMTSAPTAVLPLPTPHAHGSPAQPPQAPSELKPTHPSADHMTVIADVATSEHQPAERLADPKPNVLEAKKAPSAPHDSSAPARHHHRLNDTTGDNLSNFGRPSTSAEPAHGDSVRRPDSPSRRHEGPSGTGYRSYVSEEPRGQISLPKSAHPSLRSDDSKKHDPPRPMDEIARRPASFEPSREPSAYGIDMPDYSSASPQRLQSGHTLQSEEGTPTVDNVPLSTQELADLMEKRGVITAPSSISQDTVFVKPGNRDENELMSHAREPSNRFDESVVVSLPSPPAVSEEEHESYLRRFLEQQNERERVNGDGDKVNMSRYSSSRPSRYEGSTPQSRVRTDRYTPKSGDRANEHRPWSSIQHLAKGPPDSANMTTFNWQTNLRR